ncbi:MAG: hypothetical protein MUF34_23625 [Polyangiaceae bacterium]|nr:hypothetical protein [Polyangiaceae bacterium]
MTNDELWLHLEGLLAQADELSSADNPSAACARARSALDGLAQAPPGGPEDEARRDEFRARAEHELRHYDRRLVRWQAGVGARAADHLDRERWALANPMMAERPSR